MPRNMTPRVVRLKGLIYCLNFDVKRMLDDNVNTHKIIEFIEKKLEDIERYKRVSYVNVYER